MTKFLRLSCMFVLGASLLSSCLKQKYDAPPDASQTDPMLPVTATLADLSLSAINMASGTWRIMGDTTVYGIVVGNDKADNIYKQLYIEDTNRSGMLLLIDKTNLYGDYPVGRKVYLKTKGLYLINYHGLPEIAYYYDTIAKSSTGIPSSLIGNYVIPGSYPHIITPKVVTIADVFSSPNSYLNTLVQLDSMEFNTASAGVVYSLATASTNRTIQDCPFTGSLTMYNSNYASFQHNLTPTGRGSITGIITIYGTAAQFVLRDTTDVMFTGPRVCP